MKNVTNFLLSICTFMICACQVLPPAALLPIPDENQLTWHEHEQYAFIHFTVNTFTDKEIGYGDESPAIFNPTEFDAEQWVSTVKNAGLKGLVLVCKHLDGFCLWPSAYTEHSIKNSPFKDGKGDIVKEVSDACRKHGIFFGIYLGPWDANSALYGTSEYIAYYRNQLTELLSNYGEVSEVWFDGYNEKNGYYGGARERRHIDGKTYYDWANTYAIVRKLAPHAVMFSDAGPDIRWCGNEKGFAGETNWATMPAPLSAGMPNSNVGLLNSGSENGTVWMPAEVDVSIRPGWFYHATEDAKVRTPENLLKLYLQSVGRGSNLLLNLPPDRRGRIHENDVKALTEWKKLLDAAFATNLAEHAKASSDKYRGSSKRYAAKNVTDGNKETYWATDDNVTAGSIEIDLGKSQTLNYVAIQEYIKLGQRVKNFDVEVWKDNAWVKVATGTTVGYKRILPLNAVVSSKIRINITNAKACPLISNIAVY